MAVQFNPFTGNLDIVGAGASANPGGSDTQVQFNNAGAFGGSADLTWDDTGKVLGVGGDVDLDDGGTYTTTLQTITATANRTISFPDATGTVALVAGSSGQLIYNSAGANAGVSGSVVGATGDVALSLAGAASTPPLKLSGTWFTGGTATTTKPQVLIEPSGTTSTAWSTSGTGLGVNAASGFAGNLLDLQVNGTSQFSASHNGIVNAAASVTGGGTRISSGGVECSNARSVYFTGTLAGTVNWGDLFIARDAANTLAQRNSTNAQTYRLYNTYTDASNYQRTSITDDSTGLVIDQQYAGTGAARTNLLDLKNNGTSQTQIQSNGALLFGSNNSASTPKLRTATGGGTGYGIYYGATQNGFFYSWNGAPTAGFSIDGVQVVSNKQIAWTNSTSAPDATRDTGLTRDQAGVVAITNGSTGTGYLKQTPVAVSALPAAATVGAGTRGFVSDSTVAASGNFGATVTGGGSNNVPVFSDGTNWLIG